MFNIDDKNQGTSLLRRKRVLKRKTRSKDSVSSNGEGNDTIIAKNELKGRWNRFEHLRFVKGCLMFGNDWTKVEILTLVS